MVFLRLEIFARADLGFVNVPPMRGTSFGLCKFCFRPLSSTTNGSTGSLKSLPPRIFTTETTTEDGPKSFQRIGSRKLEAPNMSSSAKSHDGMPTSAERLSNDFRKLLRTKRTRDSRDLVARSTDAKTKIKLMSRMPGTSTNIFTKPTSPTDLLHPPDLIEMDEDISSVIERCLRTALQRLDVGTSGVETQPTKRQLIPHDQYLWLCNILHYQFTKSQLVTYGTKCGLAKSRFLRMKTEAVIRSIISELWNIDKEKEIAPDETMITKSGLSFHAETYY